MPTLAQPVFLSNQLLTKILRWANDQANFVYFNPNEHQQKLGTFEHMLAVSNRKPEETSNDSFESLQASINQHKKYHVGFFSYELKNELYPLSSQKKTTVPVPHALFFIPEVIIKFEEESLTIESEDPEATWSEINNYSNQSSLSTSKPDINCTTTKNEYIENCKKIKKDIVDGEYYEINYCIEFKAENCTINPIEKYLELNQTSPMPFSCLGKFNDIYTLCASPERFIKKSKDTLISQPIKGTIRRGRNEEEDQQLKTILRNSQKEIAENMMIIDLVRNDLNRSSKTGSVKVEEYFGIYSYKQVHQMVSTISAIKKPGLTATEVIRNAFPMGSMTGAPKLRVMQAIEQYEHSQRGVYSGSIGYFTPEGDFDFNVVIRSIIYDRSQKKLSFHVGSAITYDADPEYEYEECMLKAKSMMEILSRE